LKYRLRNGEVAAGSQTLERALRTLFRVGEAGPRGLSLAECALSLGYSKPTVHRILRTLLARGFLRHDEERGIYMLGVTNLRLGMTFLEQLDLRAEALPILREVGRRSGETVHLGVLDRSDVVYIEKVESTHAVRMFSQIGHTMPAYSTGIGKAILASLSFEELDDALPKRLEARTPATITDRKELLAHLAETRERGYSIDDVENEDGIRCVGAPVFDHTGTVCAGISIAGPVSRLTRERTPELGELVREAALDISQRLGYAGEPVGIELVEAQ
jgi:DNA-binding IclR family transcriptional regulator